MCFECLWSSIGNYLDGNMKVFPKKKRIRLKKVDKFGDLCDILLHSFLEHCIDRDKDETLNDVCDISDCCVPDFYTYYDFKTRKHFNKFLEALGNHEYYHYNDINKYYKYKK